MKIKMLILFIITCLFSFFIYNYCFVNNINYVSIGSSLSYGMTPFNDQNKSYSDFFYEYLISKNKLKSYNNTFSFPDITVEEMLGDIKNNRCEDNVCIDNILSKANIITISIGFEEYLDALNDEETDNLDRISNNIEEIITTIRKINDCKIFIIGYYNPTGLVRNKRILTMSNEMLLNLEKYKKVYFVNISDGFEEKYYYVPNVKNAYPTIEGYNYINNRILEVISEKRLIL